MGEHITRCTQEAAFRQRYLSLLVPAIARIDADHPQGSGLQRVRAVRRLADACLVAAASTRGNNFKPSLLTMIRRRGRRSYNPRLLLMKRRLIKTRRFCYTKPGSYIKALRSSASHKSSRSARLNLKYRDNHAACNHEATIPTESDLKRLQKVIYPHSKPEAGAAINPATLLKQAAHYILALQVQVDALHTLAQAVDSAASSSTLS